MHKMKHIFTALNDKHFKIQDISFLIVKYDIYSDNCSISCRFLQVIIAIFCNSCVTHCLNSVDFIYSTRDFIEKCDHIIPWRACVFCCVLMWNCQPMSRSVVMMIVVGFLLANIIQ